MELREILTKEEWEDGLQSVSFCPFTQSFVWGEFQVSLGKSVKRLFVEEGTKTLAACQLVFERRPFVGGYWLAPKGPVFIGEAGLHHSVQIINELKKYAQRHLRSGVFLRIEPMIEADTVQFPSGWTRKKSFNPSSTRRLDLRQSEAVLLEGMHQKTRYNIRVAEKKGVKVELGEEEAFVDFLLLMKETAERGRFAQHDNRYLQKTFTALRERDMAKLRLAKHEGDVVAGQLEIWYGDTVTYLYGASASTKRNVMAPYALHWAALTEAKASGMHWYDLWGENPADHASIEYRPKWEGITRFKNGFGGEHIEFVGTFDGMIRKIMYCLLRLLRRI